jgi:beta-lactam-binding protein with PASTA domain
VGDQKSIPDVTCDSIDDARNSLEDAGFSVYVGGEVDSTCPKGTVAETNPSNRTIKGGVVMISPSNGRQNQPSTPAGQPAQPGGQPGQTPRR